MSSKSHGCVIVLRWYAVSSSTCSDHEEAASLTLSTLMASFVERESTKSARLSSDRMVTVLTCRAAMGWDGIGSDRMIWDGHGADLPCGWDGMGSDRMGWDGMVTVQTCRAAMGWDGMGWDRIGSDGIGVDLPRGRAVTLGRKGGAARRFRQDDVKLLDAFVPTVVHMSM